MERTLYLAILTYFVLGAIAFAIIGMKKASARRREIWAKYVTYFLIIHALFAGIYFGPHYFAMFALLIAVVGYVELTGVWLRNEKSKRLMLFLLSLLVYTIILIPFILFSLSEKPVLYFAFVVVSVFDAFSQISGQLWGKKKLIPRVSPGKTLGGLVGGAVLAMITGTLIGSLLSIEWSKALFFTAIIIIFAFWGDFLASYYKRRFNVKDFGKLLPGHGGFLDRFDSLIPGGAAMYLLIQLL